MIKSWSDPEDYMLYEIALALKADAVITRNQDDFPRGVVPIESCDEFFRRLELERGLAYDEAES